jgi:hypothetical protein
MTTKLSKKELKAILKECLREIMEEEGLMLEASGRPSKTSAAKRISGVSLPEREEKTFSNNAPALPSDMMDGVNPLLLERVNNAVGTIGSDAKDMFQKIFLDTAVTTLQSQEGAGHSVLQGGSSYSSPTAAAAALSMAETLSLDSHSSQTHSEAVSSPSLLLEQHKQLESMAPAGDMKLWAKIAFSKK